MPAVTSQTDIVQCPKCTTPCIASGLAKHMKRHDFPSTTPAVAKKAVTSRPKIHACGRCEVVFSDAYKLTYHMRHHTGDKPHKCKWEGCDAAFPNPSNECKHRKLPHEWCGGCSRHFLLSKIAKHHCGPQPQPQPQQAQAMVNVSQQLPFVDDFETDVASTPSLTTPSLSPQTLHISPPQSIHTLEALPAPVVEPQMAVPQVANLFDTDVLPVEPHPWDDLLMSMNNGPTTYAPSNPWDDLYHEYFQGGSQGPLPVLPFTLTAYAPPILAPAPIAYNNNFQAFPFFNLQ